MNLFTKYIQITSYLQNLILSKVLIILKIFQEIINTQHVNIDLILKYEILIRLILIL